MESRPENSTNTGTGVKAIRATARFVRGPVFSTAVSLLLLLLTAPAQAHFLRGYLQQSESNEPVVAGNDYSQPQIAPETTRLHRSMIEQNSFPMGFAGAWKCVTIVVDSAIDTVSIGQTVESAVNFTPGGDGRVTAYWEQPGWTETQCNVTPLSSSEVNLDRTNYYTRHGERSGWMAHSLDKYVQLDANRITANSMVEQFVNGHYLGRYRTRSMLYRVSGNIALAK